ncbi:hypothetical protein BJ138DRAFT_1119628 [Hygrophoropsis aurantiaca]|uniref:Uncharacterized protein n=1 Tax=Hygrophoropsis aurantiaca TaxID=72124 RepID=A0ACB7ZU49_9AGAM|nr:hypothetical protein BJ138DRAFT_1119628 [Hygrophoropsis aurantiaca]
MLYPSENDGCIDDGHNPAPDSASLLTKNECRTPSGSARNNTTKQLRALCYFSHGTIFALHIVVLVVYKFRAEHRITITTVTVADIVATVLAVSLQAFYTVYTAVLVFVTQRLALSYIFSRRQKLTSIHDIAEAWIGIGAALFGLWDQIKVKTSMRATIAVTVYLLSISALHITSSSIMQLQTFNATITVPISTTVGWPDESVDLASLAWSSIDPFIPATSQLATLSTAGISNSTIYDLVSRNSGFGEAIVNATTVSASCGLLPASQDLAQDSATLNLNNDVQMGIVIPQPFFTTERYVDVQTNALVEAAPLPDANQQWTMLTFTDPSTLDYAISVATQAAGPSSAIFLNLAPGSEGRIINSSPSVLDAYMMSLFGLNATADVNKSQYESSSNPNFTLGQYQLESAVAQIVAEAIWMAGQLGQEGGGFSRSTGETGVTQYLLQWRLNINLAPLIVATLASFIAFLLAIEMTGRIGTHKPDGSHTVKSASPLELLWLAAHMPGLTTGFKDIEKPTMNNLREAGMFDVCLIGSDVKILSDDDLNKDLGS